MKGLWQSRCLDLTSLIFLWRDFHKELREPEQSKKHTSESVTGRMMDTRTLFHDILKGTDACVHDS